MKPAVRSSGDRWSTSVGELMWIFRDALRALVPHFDRARIPWKEPDAYDDWDLTADVLFNVIVVNSLRWALGNGEQVLSVPKYGMSYPAYPDMSFIAVKGDTPVGHHLLVRALATRAAPLDVVDCVLVRSDGELLDTAPRCVLFESAHFEWQHRLADGRLEAVDSLLVLT